MALPVRPLALLMGHHRRGAAYVDDGPQEAQEVPQAAPLISYFFYYNIVGMNVIMVLSICKLWVICNISNFAIFLSF